MRTSDRACLQVNVVQPAGIVGEVKLITPLTMENIADAVVAEGLASPVEIEQLVGELSGISILASWR